MVENAQDDVVAAATVTEAKAPAAPGLPPVDVNEYGGKKNGERQAMNDRLFMQLLVFDVPAGGSPSSSPGAVAQALKGHLHERKIPAVVYADAMAPRGLGLLTWSRDPAHFVDAVRPVFDTPALCHVELRQPFGMIGRSYSTGHEPDLAYVLLQRPIDNVLNEELGWHVWYPLRRKGSFAKLEPIDQSHILREHAALGMAYGQKDLAHDIRLACHGLDAEDNEFVIGLVGKELHPLSHLVQAMRKTRQTSEFIEKMGPFFVGRAIHRVA